MKHYRTVKDLEQFRDCMSMSSLKAELKEGETVEVPVESVFQSEIMQSLKKWKLEGHIDPDAMFWKQMGGAYVKTGLPDIFLVCEGRLVGLEVKRPFGLGKATDIQRQKIQDLRNAGADATIVSFPKDVKIFLEMLNLWREK